MRAVPFAAVVFLCVLAGCTTTPRIEGPQQPVDLATLKNWHASGRIAVAAAGTGGSGSFDWEQQGTKTEVRIQGPVGIGGLRLELEGDAVALESSDGRRLQAEAAWAELEARLGAPVPARNLRYWLLGIPAPGEFRWLPPQPLQATLVQDSWQIAYERFGESPQSGDSPPLRLPTRLTATSGGSRVRLIIDRWQLGAE